MTGIPELVSSLQSRGKDVFLVSGGFRVIIEPIAEILNIPKQNVFANNILHKVRHSDLLPCIACRDESASSLKSASMHRGIMSFTSECSKPWRSL